MTRRNAQNGLLPAPTCYGETGVMDFGIMPLKMFKSVNITVGIMSSF